MAFYPRLFDLFSRLSKGGRLYHFNADSLPIFLHLINSIKHCKTFMSQYDLSYDQVRLFSKVRSDFLNTFYAGIALGSGQVPMDFFIVTLQMLSSGTMHDVNRLLSSGLPGAQYIDSAKGAVTELRRNYFKAINAARNDDKRIKLKEDYIERVKAYARPLSLEGKLEWFDYVSGLKVGMYSEHLEYKSVKFKDEIAEIKAQLLELQKLDDDGDDDVPSNSFYHRWLQTFLLTVGGF